MGDENPNHKVGLLIKECINHILWATRPRKDKLYRMYKELRELEYKVETYEVFAERCERYYNHRTPQNQTKLIRDILRLPPNSEVGRILSLDFRTGEVDAKKLLNASTYIFHQLRFAIDVKKNHIDETLIYNALKKITNPSHLDKTHSFEFRDYWEKVEDTVWRTHGGERLENVKTLGVILDPKAPIENMSTQHQGEGSNVRGREDSKEDASSGDTTSNGYTDPAKGDHYTGNPALLTKSITQTEYEWLRQLRLDCDLKRKALTKYPLSKRSEVPDVRKAEDLVRYYNLEIDKANFSFEETFLAELEAKKKEILDVIVPILDIFDREPEPVVRFIRNGYLESELRPIFLKPDEIDIVELKVLISMLKKDPNYRWRGQVKWHRGGKTMYVFKAKELFGYRNR